ncbi:MAG: hypothetical protein IJ086_01600 [Clostridium sp.]|nr:hypothetical protein [Clostridium sp.]
MSRVEKANLRKIKQKKLRLISKVIFIISMSVNLLFCIYIVEVNAKKLLGEEVSFNQINIDKIKANIAQNIENINLNITNIINQFNK